MSGLDRDGAKPNPKKPPMHFSAFKLLVDPWLLKGASKLYRYDGNVPEDPTYPTVTVRDPRNSLAISRRWNRLEAAELPVPRFKIDSNYVGIPPPVEVTLTNLNDNIDKGFLTELLQKNGTVDELCVYYHPTTKKHLGLARAVFETIKGARLCVEKLNNTPVMGKTLSVFFDPFGEKCKSTFEDMTIEKTADPPKPEDRPSIDTHSKTNVSRAVSSNIKDNHIERGGLSVPQRSTRNEASGSQDLDSVPLSTKTTYHGREKSHDSHRHAGGSFDNFATPVDDFGIKTYSALPQQYNPQPPSVVLPVASGPSISTPLLPSGKHGSDAMLPKSIPRSEANVPRCEADDYASHKMDLDTRIKLLLRENSSTPFGKFLGYEASDSENEETVQASKVRQKRTSLCLNRDEIWESDSDDSSPEKRFAKKFKKNTFVPVEDSVGHKDDKLSPPPSPFLTHKDYSAWKLSNKNHESKQLDAGDDGLDEVSGESDSHPSPMHDRTKDYDEPGEDDPSLIQLPPEPSLPVHLPPDPSGYAQMLGLTPFYPSTPPFPQPIQNPGFPSSFPNYQGWPASHSLPVQFPPVQFFGTVYPYPANIPPPPPETVEEKEDQQAQNTELIIRTVFERLIDELKEILRRDIQRRMVETMAFRAFEAWWVEKEQAYKDQQAEQRYIRFRPEPKTDKLDPRNNEPGNLPIDASAPGLGFRASIPKLPSFRRIPRAPSPARVYEDSRRKSVEESDFDDESEIEVRQRQRVRKLSLSSQSTSSSTEGSSSDLDSDDSTTSSDTLDSISTKTLVDKTEKEIRDDIASWVESISEDEAFSPLPSTAEEKMEILSPVQEVVAASSVQVSQEKESAAPIVPAHIKLEKEEEEVKGPSRPASPIRVGPGGPYLHMHDHNYTKEGPEVDEPIAEESIVDVFDVKTELPKKGRAKQVKVEVAEKSRDVARFTQRTSDEERNILTEFLKEGVDSEDMIYLKQCYELMQADETQGYWLSTTRWVDHPITRLPDKDKAKRVHSSGSARTEGFYKLSLEEKQKHKQQWAFVGAIEYSAPGTSGATGVTALTQDKSQGKTQIEKSREARSNQRRLLTALGNELDSSSDLLKFNQLKFRKKSLCFRRSCIHDWGLFAAEPIAADEMVIEYVGQTIRPYLADIRERKYEASGIGSSYLFRIDLENIIDATKCGNLSRFINHSCNPNCYAKIITIEGEKKIVIYSKQPIGVNEEITYDYKFPIEDQKIACLCGTPQCRGTLN